MKELYGKFKRIFVRQYVYERKLQSVAWQIDRDDIILRQHTNMAMSMKSMRSQVSQMGRVGSMIGGGGGGGGGRVKNVISFFLIYHIASLSFQSTRSIRNSTFGLNEEDLVAESKKKKKNQPRVNDQIDVAISSCVYL